MLKRDKELHKGIVRINKILLNFFRIVDELIFDE